MKFRNTIILIAIALLLGGYVYFFEIKGKNDERDAASDAAAALWDFHADAVIELTVRDGENIMHVSRSEDGKTWLMDRPAQDEADPDRIRRAISSLARVRASRTIPPQEAGNLGDFGLERPVMDVTLRQVSGATLKLLIGDHNPQKTDYYVMKADERDIHLIDAGVVNIVKQLVSEPPHRPTSTITPTAPSDSTTTL